jgi:hypothetical protein
VVKTRARGHSRDLRAYEVTSKGIVVGKRLSELTGVITAVPEGHTPGSTLNRGSSVSAQAFG